MTANLSKNGKLLGLGCSTFGGSKSKKTALHTLHVAFDNGVNYFDVARSYGYGQAESIVGEFIQGKRDRVIITSKFGIAPPKPFPFMAQVKDVVRYAKKMAPGITQKAIQTYSTSQVSRPPITPRLTIQSLEISLGELKTDYLDFYLLHDCPFEDVVSEDIFAALEKAKDKGMIRAWGATCENDNELYKYFEDYSPIRVVQFPYRFNDEFVQDKTHPSLSKVIFSVMSQSAGRKEPPPSFFNHLSINQQIPGLIQNLREAWLYIASRELENGVVLCSMTQEEHIQRNIAIIHAPDLSAKALQVMKRNVVAGRELPKPIESGRIKESII
ncbi:MAG: aldo/keto reductase [Saprospiraceae bacterium]